MKLDSPQKDAYEKDRISAIKAQRRAMEIAFGPVVFQVSRLMVKFGILKMLGDSKEGLSLDEIVEKTSLSKYGVQCLLESSLTIGTIYLEDDKFYLSKTGWFLLNDEMARVNMDFVQDVNYNGLFYLEDAIRDGKPAGLKVFGSWPTIYEGLSSLPEDVQKSWFGFDHYYSDCSFQEALAFMFKDGFKDGKKKLLDVGGNTGRFATECVAYRGDIEVTVMDLPQQCELLKENTKGIKGSDRIHTHPCNLLNPEIPFPSGFEIIWMSQFLDCFSNDEVISILSRAARSMTEDTRLYIMETLWDRQRFETASYCLAQTSIYFTALANGNSKMFYSYDLYDCIEQSGLEIDEIHDGLGKGHSLIACKRR